MDEKLERKLLRRRFNSVGWMLLIYCVIMNVCVTGVVLIQTLVELFQQIAEHGMGSFDRWVDTMVSSLMGNAWGYFLAAAIGFALLIGWKGRKYVFSDLWSPGKPMTPGACFGIVCVFVGGQLVFQSVAAVMEFIFNLFGLSIMGAVESASLANTDSFSMFLYGGLLAPVAEEILFRGVVQRSLMPYGKKFAILTSAILFGAFHGNLVQSPFAFAVGLVLGYVAAEYSILWAMALHMFNNLIISDLLTRLSSVLPYGLGDLLSWLLIIVMSIAGVIVLVVHRAEVGRYLHAEKISGRYMGAFFTSPGILALLVFMLLTALSGISFL